MVFKQLPRNLQLELALRLCKEDAERGRDSFFDCWWYFDTNCVSELVKLSSQGYASNVRDFVREQYILLSSATMQELRKAPDVLQSLLSSLDTARVYLTPDITRFWYTDIFNFLNDAENPVPMNSLQVYPLQPELMEMIVDSHRDKFEQACLTSERDVAQRFFETITPDIGASLDERDLCIYIWNVANKFGKEWFDIDIPIVDCHSGNFPTFYVFYYVYYFRYVKSGDTKPELNDFIDLANCLASPYCERFYCEARFATILRNYVKGRTPPTAFQLVKKLFKKGMINREIYNAQRRAKTILSRTSPLLEKTDIFSFSEMRSQVIG